MLPVSVDDLCASSPAGKLGRSSCSLRVPFPAQEVWRWMRERTSPGQAVSSPSSSRRSRRRAAEAERPTVFVVGDLGPTRPHRSSGERGRASTSPPRRSPFLQLLMQRSGEVCPRPRSSSTSGLRLQGDPNIVEVYAGKLRNVRRAPCRPCGWSNTLDPEGGWSRGPAGADDVAGRGRHNRCWSAARSPSTPCSGWSVRRTTWRAPCRRPASRSPSDPPRVLVNVTDDSVAQVVDDKGGSSPLPAMLAARRPSPTTWQPERCSWRRLLAPGTTTSQEYRPRTSTGPSGRRRPRIIRRHQPGGPSGRPPRTCGPCWWSAYPPGAAAARRRLCGCSLDRRCAGSTGSVPRSTPSPSSELSRRVGDGDRQNEAGRLPTTMTQRLEQASEPSCRRFVADAPHDKRSPRTAQRTQLEVADGTPRVRRGSTYLNSSTCWPTSTRWTPSYAGHIR